MKKTSLYLDPELDHAITRRADAEGITKAEFVRRALAAAARGSIRPRPAACGVFDGPRDLARDADRHLAETGFGDK